jgi:hypothetical protein
MLNPKADIIIGSPSYEAVFSRMGPCSHIVLYKNRGQTSSHLMGWVVDIISCHCALQEVLWWTASASANCECNLQPNNSTVGSGRHDILSTDAGVRLVCLESEGYLLSEFCLPVLWLMMEWCCCAFEERLALLGGWVLCGGCDWTK